MTEKIKATCSKCGKEFELDARWKKFAENNPDKLTCLDCKSGGKKASSGGDSKTSESGATKTGVKTVSAKDFKKAFDELRAEFADDYEEAKEFMGGWTSTIVLSRNKPMFTGKK